MSDDATRLDGGVFLTRGHPGALSVLARAIRTERPPHALLLVGPRSVGKTTLALDLAAGLVCLAADPVERPCRDCQACRKVASGNHPDIHMVGPVGAGEQIRIGQVQELSAELALTALEGRFRLAVITAAHRLNPDAQNALLKTLEEPPPATSIVLCADDAAPLLPTIVSRTAHLRLAPLPVEVLARELVADGIAQPAQARSLAIAAAGRPGSALSLASQPDAVMARSRIARTLLGLLTGDRRARLSSASELIADGAAIDAALRAEIASTKGRLQPVERRRAVAVVLEAWRDVGRDLAVTARGSGKGVRDLDLLDELRVGAGGVHQPSLHAFLDDLDRMILAIESYASPELVLDHLLLAWPRSRLANQPAA